MTIVQYFRLARSAPWRKIGMKHLLLPALPLALLAAASLLPSLPAGATGMKHMDEPPSGWRGKIAYCTYCHGVSGRGYTGYYTMPRLAGQPQQYILNQLRAFMAGTRDRALAVRMSVVHGMSPSAQAAAAEHFSNVELISGGGASGGNIAEGRRIFTEGAPDSNVPACLACHGPEAKGGNFIPRLAGQLPAYTRGQLANWNKMRSAEAGSSENTAVMSPIAANMSPSQIDAVAAYVSSMK